MLLYCDRWQCLLLWNNMSWRDVCELLKFAGGESHCERSLPSISGRLYNSRQ